LPSIGRAPTRPSAHQLELVRIVAGELLSVLHGGRLADDFVLRAIAVRRRQPVLHEPATVQALRYRDRGPAPAERVEDHIAFIAAGGDDALKYASGFCVG
jgi:hypothetical protein